MNVILLLAMLSAMPQTLYVYVQDGCTPCRQDQVQNGFGDSGLLLLYVNISANPNLVRPGLVSTPGYYDPKRNAWQFGRRTLPQLKAWLNPQTVAATGYPLRRGSPVYVYINRRPYYPSSQHLSQGEHLGKFDQAWLRSLSQADLLWLHTDDHHNRVDWSYAKRAR